MGKRSRKRRDAPGRAAPAAAPAPPDVPEGLVARAKTSWKVGGELAPKVATGGGARPRRERPQPRASAGRRDRGERPEALWGKAPISELAILAGLIVLGVGFSRGADRGGPTIGIGLAIVGLAVLEVAAREHLTGYRSHTLILALIVTVILHFLGALVLGSVAKGPGVLAVDVVVFGLLASVLSKQYKISRLQTARTRSR